MKRELFLIGTVFLLMTVLWAFSSCSSCSDERAKDVSGVPGIYDGEATLVVPESLKAMINRPDSTGNTPIPDGPIPCKLEIKANENNELEIQLVDFTMPVEGVVLTPVKCHVTQEGKVFNLAGDGEVTFGERKLSYSHEGKVEERGLNMEGTISIIPKLLEVKIVFKGEKV